MTMMNKNNNHNDDNVRDEAFATPSDVADVAAQLDRLAAAERSGVDGAMRDRIARASGIALSAGEDQALARTASALDRVAADDRAGVDGAMVGRVAGSSSPARELAGGVVARIGFRQWRMAAGIAVAGLAVGGATWLMGPSGGGGGGSMPSVAMGEETAEFMDVLFDEPTDWASPFDADDDLAVFETSVDGVLDSLSDPWGGLDWSSEGGAL